MSTEMKQFGYKQDDNMETVGKQSIVKAVPGYSSFVQKPESSRSAHIYMDSHLKPILSTIQAPQPEHLRKLGTCRRIAYVILRLVPLAGNVTACFSAIATKRRSGRPADTIRN